MSNFNVVVPYACNDAKWTGQLNYFKKTSAASYDMRHWAVAHWPTKMDKVVLYSFIIILMLKQSIFIVLFFPSCSKSNAKAMLFKANRALNHWLPDLAYLCLVWPKLVLVESVVQNWWEILTVQLGTTSCTILQTV